MTGMDVISQILCSTTDACNKLCESPDHIEHLGRHGFTLSYDNTATISFAIARKEKAFICRLHPENESEPSLGHTELRELAKEWIGLAAEDVEAFQDANNFYAWPNPVTVAKLLMQKPYEGRIFVDEGVVTFWDPLVNIFPAIDQVLRLMLQMCDTPVSDLKVEYWCSKVIDANLRKKWSDGRNDWFSLLVPYQDLSNFLNDVGQGPQQQHAVPTGDRHLAAAKGVSNPVVRGSGSYKAASQARHAGYDTVAAYRAAQSSESRRRIKAMPLAEEYKLPDSTISYAKSWHKSVKKMPPQIITEIDAAITDFKEKPGDHRFRYHSLVRFKGLYSIDLFKWQATLYKAIIRPNHNDYCFIWAGTHESYNTLLRGDWLKHQ